MGANDRIVQHLRLRAPSQQAATRVVNRLEDALRCASLPDAGERLLLVRRIDLGRLPAGGSSQSLSLLIEQRMAALGGEWVHGDEARAARSDTVFFASRLQAAQAALRRRARGADLAAWYWPLALPGVQTDAAPGLLVEQVVGLLAQGASAPVALPALAASMVAAGESAWLLRHLGDAPLQRLLAVCGAGQHGVSMADPGAADPAPVQAWRSPLGHTVARARGEAWPAWLPALLRAAQWAPVDGAAPAAPVLPHRATSAARSASPPWPQNRPERWPEVAPTPQPLSTPAVSARPHRDDPVAGSLDEPGAALHADGPVGLTWRPAADVSGPGGAWRTAAGGLLFLVPVLERLGFAAWQARHPDTPLAGRILYGALRRLRVLADDPVWALVASLPAPRGPQERQAAGWARTWLALARRHLWRRTRLGLATLCLRPAAIQWGPTHLDVRFALGDVDIRVRRQALDLDPGWVPWLGRVVGFRYEPSGGLS